MLIKKKTKQKAKNYIKQIYVRTFLILQEVFFLVNNRNAKKSRTCFSLWKTLNLKTMERTFCELCNWYIPSNLNEE